MKLKPLQCIFCACSDAKMDVATKAHWFQTTPPYGEYQAGDMVTDPKGKPIHGAMIIFDERSTDRIMAAFNAASEKDGWPGILVDQEHYSLDYDKPSTALAWAKEIRRAEDGSLWTRWDFTEMGEKLYDGKMLINRSPVLILEKLSARNFSPAELESIGMTNTPHFKQLSPLALAAKENKNQKGNTDMDPEILAALGLAADAGKDEVLAAVKVLQDKEAAALAKATEKETAATQATTEKEAAVAECRGMKADAFISKNSEKIADAAAFKAIYLENPSLAEKTLAVCKAVTAAPGKDAPTQVRIVAKEANTPAKTAGASGDAKIAPRNKAVNEYRSANKCSFQSAWAACRVADPELFSD